MKNNKYKYGIELDSLGDALHDIQNGKPIILLDNPGREGEGDFIISAAKVSVEWMNFILMNARGAFVAVFMTENQANYFQLPAQIDPNKNRESSKTNFRLTCDTAYGHSGCSAIERAQTANILGGSFIKYEGRFHYDDQELDDFCFESIELLNNHEDCLTEPEFCDNNILYLTDSDEGECSKEHYSTDDFIYSNQSSYNETDYDNLSTIAKNIILHLQNNTQ